MLIMVPVGRVIAVAAVGGHRARTKVPNRAAFGGVLDVQNFAVTNEQARVLEATPEFSDARPLRTNQDQRASQRKRDVTQIVTDGQLWSVFCAQDQGIETEATELAHE